jgi:proteasome lid subunit RPN8/RPN11
MVLKPDAIQVLARAVRDAGAREIAGFILGSSTGEQQVLLARNCLATPGSFLIGELEVRRIERYARRRGLRIEAFVHSHRFSLDLSTEDETGLRATGCPWIVVMMEGDQLKYKVFQKRRKGTTNPLRRR